MCGRKALIFMRNYLIDFFEKFAYEKDDADCLLAAYDAILAKEEAAQLLSEILSLYETDEKQDFTKEILEKRARVIAQMIALPAYTVELLIFICMTKHLKTLYIQRGLSKQIYRDSVLDLKWKLEECKLVKGVCGSFVAPWFGGFFDLTRFALGRLQFEVIAFSHHYEKNGVTLTPQTKVINVHIPRTGTPIDKASCDDAYKQAQAFFADEVGENAPFVCHSWLLFPKHLQMLSPSSNIYRFLSEYEILKSGTNSGHDLWRLFDTDERDPEKLPCDSSLRRRYVEYLKGGGKPGYGFGIRFLS